MQVAKICCNHFVSPQLELQSSGTSNRSWIWNAQDLSDRHLVQVTLGLKLKTKEQAQRFKKVFDEAKRVDEEDEDWETLFCEPATLLRYHQSTWKERDGDFKILRHPVTGRTRFAALSYSSKYISSQGN